MDPTSNALVGKKTKKQIQVKDLFGGNQGEDSEVDLMEDGEDSFNMAGNGFFDGSTQEKSYTLTMICDPEESGLDKKFQEYRRYMVEKEGF